MSRKSAVALIATALLAMSCATTSTREATSEALDKILAAEQRSEGDRALDRYRHPKETLLFFGIRPEMSVLEVWPEPGWYTDIIAPLVKQKGKYTAAVMGPDPTSQYVTGRVEKYQQKLASRPDLYGSVTTVAFPKNGGDVVPPGSVDMVLTFLDIHNWMAQSTDQDMTTQAFTSLYRALKPGGVLGVVEHKANADVPQDPHAKNGYVNEEYAIKLIESVGFRLVAKSQINANPKDTKDYEQGVWTLPPTYRLGDRDHDKYAAIGESDRFTLKFEKPKKR